jgi:hypothetical protein
MHGELENWNNGWYGLRLALSADELEQLILRLNELRRDPEQHFHVSSNYSGAGGIGDIEFSVAGPEAVSNLSISSVALAPGSEVPPADA